MLSNISCPSTQPVIAVGLWRSKAYLCVVTDSHDVVSKKTLGHWMRAPRSTSNIYNPQHQHIIHLETTLNSKKPHQHQTISSHIRQLEATLTSNTQKPHWYKTLRSHTNIELWQPTTSNTWDHYTELESCTLLTQILREFMYTKWTELLSFKTLNKDVKYNHFIISFNKCQLT